MRPEILAHKVFEPILRIGRQRVRGLDIRLRVKGGGQVSQIYAIRQALAKAIVAYYQKCEYWLTLALCFVCLAGVKTTLSEDRTHGCNRYLACGCCVACKAVEQGAGYELDRQVFQRAERCEIASVQKDSEVENRGEDLQYQSYRTGQ